mmetsp:Transcript_22254/g.66804  ORF Transcript_22254/g.66804 Transcript_22254/m.66804 type:complete len:251 (-) Transcript_22254:195-947(-)
MAGAAARDEAEHARRVLHARPGRTRDRRRVGTRGRARRVRVLGVRVLDPDRYEPAQRLRRLCEGRRHERARGPGARDPKGLAHAAADGVPRGVGARRGRGRRRLAGAAAGLRPLDGLGLRDVGLQRGGVHGRALSAGLRGPWLGVARVLGPRRRVRLRLLWTRGHFSALLPGAAPRRAARLPAAALGGRGRARLPGDGYYCGEQPPGPRDGRQGGQADARGALRRALRARRVRPAAGVRLFGSRGAGRYG